MLRFTARSDKPLTTDEIIQALRVCGTLKGCMDCPLCGESADDCSKMLLAAADKLEALARPAEPAR